METPRHISHSSHELLKKQSKTYQEKTRYIQNNEKLSLKYTIALRVRSMGPTGFPGIKYEISEQYIGSEGLSDEMIEKAISEMVRDGIIEQYDDMIGQYVSGPNMDCMELPENKFELR